MKRGATLWLHVVPAKDLDFMPTGYALVESEERALPTDQAKRCILGWMSGKEHAQMAARSLCVGRRKLSAT